MGTKKCRMSVCRHCSATLHKEHRIDRGLWTSPAFIEYEFSDQPQVMRLRSGTCMNFKTKAVGMFSHTKDLSKLNRLAKTAIWTLILDTVHGWVVGVCQIALCKYWSSDYSVSCPDSDSLFQFAKPRAFPRQDGVTLLPWLWFYTIGCLTTQDPYNLSVARPVESNILTRTWRVYI